MLINHVNESKGSLDSALENGVLWKILLCYGRKKWFNKLFQNWNDMWPSKDKFFWKTIQPTHLKMWREWRLTVLSMGPRKSSCRCDISVFQIHVRAVFVYRQVNVESTSIYVTLSPMMSSFIYLFCQQKEPDLLVYPKGKVMHSRSR